MSVRAVENRLLLSAACCAVLALVGCGGAESRRARHLKNGEAFLAADNFDKARVEFRNALQIAPTDSEARYENGVVDEKLGNPREAAQFYQGAIDSNPDNVAARAALARLFLFSGAPDQALDIVKPGLAAHPADARLLTVRAAVRVQQKDPEGALVDAEEAVRLAPTNEDSVAVLAGVYKSRNENDKARTLLESTIQKIPGTVDLRLALAQLYSALGAEAKVEALLVELVRLKPRDKADRLRLAQYYTQSNHLDEAEHVLREAIAALPEERALKIALIDFLNARRSREIAGKELDGLLAANPKDYDLRLAQAQFFEQGKEFAKAEAAYRQVIADADAAPVANTARNRLAALKIGMKDVAGAQLLLADVLKKSPRDNDALILRGNLELAGKDPKSAIVDLRAVLRDQPNSVGVMRTLARAHLANVEPALAEETMRRATDVNTKDLGARLDLAQLLSQIGKPDQAKPVIDELVKLEPDNLAALDTQFKVAAAVGDLPGARAAADAIVALQPNSGLGYYYQGAAAEAAKRMDEAVRLYSVALEKQPDSSESLQSLALLLVKLNRTPEALKRLDDVTVKFAGLPLAANLKGDILLGTQRAPEAAVAYQTAIARTPTWWVPYRGLARAQSVQHDDAAAAATLQSGIGKVTEPVSLLVDLARLNEAVKPDEAIKLYEIALQKDPRSDVAANNLAMVLVSTRTDQASLDRAKDLAQRFSTSPNLAFLDTYGWVLYKRGESTAAVTVLQNVLSKAPESPVALYHLGMAQASAGQPDAARDSLTHSLKSGTAFPGMAEAKAALDKLAKLSSLSIVPSPSRS